MVSTFTLSDRPSKLSMGTVKPVRACVGKKSPMLLTTVESCGVSFCLFGGDTSTAN